MTVLRKSDAQLDAEAAANSAIRSLAIEATRYSPMGAMPPALYCGGHARNVFVTDRHGSRHLTACCLTHEARREWYLAHPDDIHVRRVPSDVEYIPAVGDVLDAGELGGPPFSITFVHYLDWPDDGLIRGLREQRRLCASRHATWADHRGRAVCGALLWSVIANGNTIATAADEVEVTPERATALLFAALRAVWTWRSREANGV